MYYIYEADKPNKLAEMFYRIKLEDNSIILPNTDILENEKVAYKLAIKTKTILDKTNSRKLVLSKKIKKYPLYLNYLYSYNYDIVEGEWLFKNLIFNILDYVNYFFKLLLITSIGLSQVPLLTFQFLHGKPYLFM